MINILTDSCCDLSPELIGKYKIDIIRLPVFINDRTYLDGLDINQALLFELVGKTGQLPKTSAPSIAEFTKFFDRLGGSFFTGIATPLSATCSNALVASQSFENGAIRVVDSLNLSTGIGLLALKAAEMRDQGRSLDEIEAVIRQSVPKVHTSFVIDTLEYVYKGGRCTAIELIVGSLLKIRPILEVRSDGTLGIREKNRGTRKKALDSLLADFHDHLNTLDTHRVFVTHTTSGEDALYLAGEIKKMVAIDDLQITLAGSTIASHAGPGCIGILYLTL